MESWSLDVGSHVPKDARVGSYGIGSVSYPAAHDPTHERAYRDVEHGTMDYAEVRYDPPAKGVSFRAWRVSSRSFAWQTSNMGAPAFMPYVSHDEPVTDTFGTFCPGCRHPLSRSEVAGLRDLQRSADVTAEAAARRMFAYDGSVPFGPVGYGWHDRDRRARIAQGVALGLI